MYEKKTIALLSSIIAPILMGTLGLFIRNVLTNSIVITFFRLFIGSIVLFIILIITKQKLFINLRCVPLIISSIFLPLTIIFYIESINRTTIANSAVLLYTGPLFAIIWTLIYDKLISKKLGKNINKFHIIFVISGLFGVFLIMENGGISIFQINSAFLFGLITGVFYSFHLFFNDIIPLNIPIFERSFVQLFIGSIIILPILLLGDFTIYSGDFPFLILIGIINGFLAITLLLYGLQILKSNRIGPLLYLEPLTASIIGLIIFLEPISSYQIIGFILILGSGFIKSLIIMKEI